MNAALSRLGLEEVSTSLPTAVAEDIPLRLESLPLRHVPHGVRFLGGQ